MSDRVRIQLDISQPLVERLDTLVEDYGFATRAEAVRRALELYAYLLEASHQRKAMVILEDPDGSHRELLVGGFFSNRSTS